MSDKRMTENKEYVERPAGINDSFKIVGVEIQEYFNEQSKEEKATKKNTKMVTPNSVKREVLSTELTQGMVIKAENGGKPKARNEETR